MSAAADAALAALASMDADLAAALASAALVAALFAAGALSLSLPGRVKLAALVLVTAWGARLAYLESDADAKVALANLGVWMLVYNVVRDEDDDDDDGHHQD